jgi:hypothetical protein
LDPVSRPADMFCSYHASEKVIAEKHWSPAFDDPRLVVDRLTPNKLCANTGSQMYCALLLYLHQDSGK